VAPLLALASAVSGPVSADVEPLRVLMLGDSITAGVRVTRFESYPGLLAEWLGEDYEIVERGCSSSLSGMWLPPGPSTPPWTMWCRGQRTPSLYETFAYAELPADIVTILLGTNDALFTSLSPADYQKNLEQIAEALLEDGAGSVVLMVPPDFPDPTRWFGSYRLALLGNRVLALCEAMPGVVCGPDLYTLLKDESYFSIVNGALNVHPNAAGHALIAEELHETILDLSPPPACEDEAGPKAIEGLCFAYCRVLDCDSVDHRGSANLCEHLEGHIRDRSSATWRLCGDDPPWDWKDRHRSRFSRGHQRGWRGTPKPGFSRVRRGDGG
jgi:lysophospholipase L1-like esterase